MLIMRIYVLIIVVFDCLGCEPSQMGIGPVPAVEKLLKVTGKTLADIDLVEVSLDISITSPSL